MKTFSIDDLIKPYEQSATKDGPKRSLSTISTKLIFGNKLPAGAVGAAIFQVFHKIAYEGLVFKGDGTLGSPGHYLFNQIRAQALSLVQTEATREVTEAIMDMTTCVINDCPKRTKLLVKKTWWQRFCRFMGKPRGPFWSL